MMYTVLSKIVKSLIVFIILSLVFCSLASAGSVVAHPMGFRYPFPNSEREKSLISAPISPVGHFETSFLPKGMIIAGGTDMVFAYGPGNDYVYQSMNRGHMWRMLPDQVYWATKQAFAISPNFDVDHTMFMGLNYGNGAFLISTDGGESWHTPQDDVIGPVVEIAVSPNFSVDHTLFVSTKDYLNRFLLRSVDGGEHWQPITPTSFAASLITKVVISPKFLYDHTLFTHLSNNNLWRSTNRGESWERADIGLETDSGNTIWDLVIIEFNGLPTLLASTSGGLMVSSDGGQNWQNLNKAEFFRLAVSKNASTGQIDIFALDSSLKKSSDWGETWTEVLVGNEISDLAISPEYASDQTVYARNLDSFWVSTDGGQNWTSSTTALMTSNPDVGRKHIMISPDFENDGIVYTILSDAILRSDDGGRSWSKLSLPASGKAVLAISPNFASDHKIFVAIGRLLYSSSDRGNNWNVINTLLPFDVQNLRISPGYPVDPTLFIAAYDRGLARSKDGGQSWKMLGDDPFLHEIELSPNYPLDHTLFASGSYGVSRSDDEGETWQDFAPLPTGGGYVIELSPSFSDDQTIFAGVTGYSGGGLARSTDRGESWTDITFSGASWYMADIAVSPRYAEDQTLIVASDSNPIYMSEDGGTTWFPLQGVPPVGGYGEKYDLAISYENGLLLPFATTPSALYRYAWPQLIAPSQIWIGIEKNITDTVHTNFSIFASEVGNIPWELQEDTQWLNVKPITGTLPSDITLTVDPTLLTTFPAQTNLNLQANWSYHQAAKATITVKVYSYTNRLWLPILVK